MKSTASILVALFLFAGLQESFSQVRVPQPSPLSTVHQKIGLMDASIVYSRPSKKGRTIFGDLVPYGEMWRTGANASTKITFGDEVKIEGQTVPAGTYSIFSIPEKGKWTIIINKGESWAAGNYKKEEDVARFEVKPTKTARAVETFTIDFSDLTNNSANINISWDRTMVTFKITTDEDQKIMASINSTIASGNATANDYNAAASYLFENRKDLNKALEYVNAAIAKFEEQQRNVFWVYHLKAKIQGQMNQFRDAIQTAEKSKTLAQEAKNNDYIRLNDKFIKEWRPKAKI
jgi:hypothetical protein